MKKIIGLAGLFLAFFSASGTAEDGHLLDRVVAVVNNDVITESELDSYLRPVYQQMTAEYQGQKLMEMVQEARTQLLNQLIEDRLVFQEAGKQDIKVEAAEIDAQIDQIRSQAPKGTDFEEILREQGLSLSELKDRAKRQIMIRRLHDIEVRSKIVISPSETEEYYKAHPEQFAVDEAVKIRSMTIRKSEEAEQKGLLDELAMSQIKELRQEVLAGEDFAELAKKHSQDTRAKEGGLSHWVKHGEMIPEIDKVIFETPTGSVTEVIETPLGYHFFKIEERKESEKKSFEEVREAIQGMLFKKKFQERFNEWLGELKRNAYISIR